MAFKKAFREARAAGKKTFTYKGKKFNTKLAAKAETAVPTKNPRKAKPTAKKKARKVSSSGRSVKTAAKKAVKKPVKKTTRKGRLVTQKGNKTDAKKRRTRVGNR